MSEQRLIGHYRIVELLGAGAMGKVHVAVDTFIEREVAIKSLRAELTRDPEFVSRFKAEATSLARLNHPNITTLYSPLLDGQDLYMVMELVRGRPLDEILRDRNGPLGVKESLAIIAQAADGLSYAHQMGVIHRDIKPSNLMISNDGRVKIMDFGIARVRGSVRLTRTGTAIGTPLYMAPEQRRGAEGDERSDLYSLAIVLYETLSGAAPFAGLDEVDLLQAQINTEPPPLVPRVPGVTPELEAAIMKALAKRAEQRFPSVRAFSDAIGATALRIDATGVVQSPAHLLEAPSTSGEGGSVANLPSVAIAVAKSRSTTLVRRFKSLHPVAQGVTAAVVAFALVSPLLFGFDLAPGVKKRDAERIEADHVSRLDAGRSATAPAKIDVFQQKTSRPLGNVDDGDQPARPQKIDTVERASQKSDCNGIFGVGDCQPSTIPAYKQPQAERVALGPAASLAELRKAFKEKDFDRAYGLAEPLAQAGDKEAQFYMGRIGLGVPGRNQSLNDAFRYFSKSAEQDYADAQVALGTMYYNGLVADVTDENAREAKAVDWYERAAKLGNPKAQYLLGLAYERGRGGRKKNTRTAAEWFYRADAQNYPDAKEALRRISR